MKRMICDWEMIMKMAGENQNNSELKQIYDKFLHEVYDGDVKAMEEDMDRANREFEKLFTGE